MSGSTNKESSARCSRPPLGKQLLLLDEEKNTSADATSSSASSPSGRRPASTPDSSPCDSSLTGDIQMVVQTPAVQDCKKTKNDSQASWLEILTDWRAILLLLLLYTIQGIPIGLAAAIPFILQEKVGYRAIGYFSLVSLPFSLKVIWAPVVDSWYFRACGRRKSWLIPVQLVSGFLMLRGSKVDAWLTGSEEPNVHALFIYFFSLYFLMATQDIVVDGWSLTVLKPNNRRFGSACNAVGQTLGYSAAYVGFLALRDPRVAYVFTETCNRIFRSVSSDVGIFSLGSFLQLWGYIVLACTALACFYREGDPEEEARGRSKLTVKETYATLFNMCQIAPVGQLAVILLTCRFAFAPVEAAGSLKLVQAGVPKESLAFMGPFLMPIALFCPVMIGKVTSSGERPLRWFILGWRFRFMTSFLFLPILSVVHLYGHGSSVPLWIYGILFFVSVSQSLGAELMFSTQMAFFAHVADPTIGGTYMTFLNAATNLGNKWPSTLALWTLDFFDALSPSGWTGGGLILQAAAFSALGLIWVRFYEGRIAELESLSGEDWMVVKQKHL